MYPLHFRFFGSFTPSATSSLIKLKLILLDVSSGEYSEVVGSGLLIEAGE